MILLTGASGLLGSNFLLVASQQGWDLVGAYHRNPVSISGVRCVRVDLLDDSSARRLVRELRPEWIVHCAALTDVDWCQEHPRETWDTNVGLTRRLASMAGEVGSRFVYISTDSVFDGEVGGYTEDVVPAPVNEYARSKLAGEMAATRMLEDVLIVRTNIYGWNAGSKPSLAEWLLAELGSGRYVSGFRDVIFTPILANDLGDIVLEMMRRRLKGTFHVAGSESCSKWEFAIHLADTFGYDSGQVKSASIADSILKAPRPRNTTLNTAKVTRALGKHMPGINAGLSRLKSLRESGAISRLLDSKGS